MIVIASLKAKPGKESAVEAKLSEMVNKVAEEKGTLIYTLHRSRENPAQFMFFEKYQDQEAFNAHCQTDYFKSLGAALVPLQDGDTQIEIYHEIVGLHSNR